MNETPPISSAANTAAGASLAHRRRLSVSGGLALILSLMAFSGTSYLWYVLKEKQGLLKGDVVKQLQQLTASNAQLTQHASSLDDELAEIRDTQDTLRTGVDKLSNDFGRARNDWLLAEAEQLLFIANHRLRLAQDVDLALAALRAADRQLKQIANPNLLPVRRQLASEINELESVNRVDFDGLSLRLGVLASKVDSWPLTTETTFKPSAVPDPEHTPPRNAWSRFWYEFAQDLRSLIRIRSDADVRQPLLAPEHQYFLRENLRLMLTSAQLALLQRNETTYHQNLKTARKWLKDYFDVQTASVASAIDDLDRMTKMQIKMRLPDISTSLAMLNKLTGRREAP